MANWLKCMTTDGTEVQLKLDQVAFIRPYQKDRDFSGSEIVFAGAAPSPSL